MSLGETPAPPPLRLTPHLRFHMLTCSPFSPPSPATQTFATQLPLSPRPPGNRPQFPTATVYDAKLSLAAAGEAFGELVYGALFYIPTWSGRAGFRLHMLQFPLVLPDFPLRQAQANFMLS